MERFIYYKNGRVIEFAGETAGIRITDPNSIALFDIHGNNLIFDAENNTLSLPVESLVQIKAKKQSEILQGFESALNSVFKILSAREIYFKATSFHQERILKLDTLSDKAIKVYNLNESYYSFTTFDCFNADGTDLNGQTVSKAEIDEMVLAIGQRVLTLESQRNTYLASLENANNELDVNNINVSYS
jgi:hypothetical protein